jgi:hypothetical protein
MVLDVRGGDLLAEEQETTTSARRIQRVDYDSGNWFVGSYAVTTLR